MKLHQDWRKAIENYIQAYNSFEVGGMLADLHQDIVFRNIANGETTLVVKGIGNFRNQAESASGLFSQREQKIEGIRFGQGMAEVDIAYSGTLAVDLPNGMLAGDKFELKGKSVFYFQNGKIIEIQDISQ